MFGIPEAHRGFNAEGYIPARKQSSLAIGLDIGQNSDPAAVLLLERRRDPEPVKEIDSSRVQKLLPPQYVVREVRQLPLGTPYRKIVGVLGDMRNCLGRVPIIADITGNRSWLELAAQIGLDDLILGLTITAGSWDSETVEGPFARVSKARLIGEVDSCLTAGQLVLPEDVAGVDVLVSELNNFKLGRSISGAPTWNAATRSGSGHDDVLLALSYTIWYLRASRGNRVSSQTYSL
jgi:hypothetical protein